MKRRLAKYCMELKCIESNEYIYVYAIHQKHN